jgi:hypothetical protein
MIFEKTEKDAAFDSELRKIQNRIDQNQRKRAQGEIDTESLLQERQHEQENSLSNHVIIGGSLLVLLSSMILFAMAKSAGMSMYYCLGFSVGTLILGNVPFLAVWMLKNKEFALTALLIIPNVCLLCCTGCTGLWYCIFWCTPPPWMRSLCCGLFAMDEYQEAGTGGGYMMYGSDGGGGGARGIPCGMGCKRRLDSLICCICQRGMCLGLTPSSCVCTQCHTSCFTNNQRRRRDKARRRRIAVTETEKGIEMKEIDSSGRASKPLSETDKKGILKSITKDRETQQHKSQELSKGKPSPKFSIRGISSDDVKRTPRRKHVSVSKVSALESPRQKTDAWKVMFTPSLGHSEGGGGAIATDEGASNSGTFGIVEYSSEE